MGRGIVFVGWVANGFDLRTAAGGSGLLKGLGTTASVSGLPLLWWGARDVGGVTRGTTSGARGFVLALGIVIGLGVTGLLAKLFGLVAKLFTAGGDLVAGENWPGENVFGVKAALILDATGVFVGAVSVLMSRETSPISGLLPGGGTVGEGANGGASLAVRLAGGSTTMGSLFWTLGGGVSLIADC